MAFAVRINYVDQVASEILKQKSDTQNAAYAVNAPATNERGDVIARDLGGLRSAPTCDFVVKKSGSLAVTLGAVHTVATEVFCILGLNITTQAGTPPTVQMGAESLQTGATASSTVTLPEIAVASLHKAQILAGAFTLSGDGCYLNDCSLACALELTRATVDGDTVSHDVHGPSLVVSGKVVQSGATPPVITAADGWKLTAPKSQDNPDEGHTEWTFEVTKDLVTIEPAVE